MPSSKVGPAGIVFGYGVAGEREIETTVERLAAHATEIGA